MHPSLIRNFKILGIRVDLVMDLQCDHNLFELPFSEPTRLSRYSCYFFRINILASGLKGLNCSHWEELLEFNALRRILSFFLIIWTTSPSIHAGGLISRNFFFGTWRSMTLNNISSQPYQSSSMRSFIRAVWKGELRNATRSSSKFAFLMV